MRRSSRHFPLLATVVFAFFGALAAQAQPANNDWANREVIAALPFADVEALIGAATVEATDPIVLCRVGAASQGGNTIWYSYTTGASVEYLNFTTATSNYDTMVSVYTGSPGDFRLVAGGCNDDGVAAVLQSRLNGLRLQPSTTYSFEIARFAASAAVVNLNLSITAAPQYNVSKTADTADGTCDADCSLREAITASNTTPGAILVPAGTYAITIAGAGEANNATGDFDIRSGMGIYGVGASSTIIDAGDLDRAIEIDSPTATNRVSAILSGLTITNASATTDGGGITVIPGNNFLTLDGVAVTDNMTTGNGGGIRSASRVAIWNSTVRGNTAATSGGGASFSGGVDTTIEVRNSTFSNNESQSAATLGGGGIHATARLRVIDSTISGNRARFGGGGILQAGTGSIVISSSTIANNTSDFDANNSGQGGGVRLESSSAVSSITNSVIANNVDNSTAAPAPDCSRTAGTIASTFNHVENVGSCAFFTGTGDVTGTDPLLDAALAANGGPTQTHRILDGSPLLDAANPAGCADYLTLAILADQRGKARVADGNGDATAVCDKGAFERNVPAAPTVLGASNPTNTTIDLSWTDNSSDETSFEIERSPDGTSGWTNVGSNPANDTTFTDTGLPINTTFFYRVFARSTTDGDSAVSNTASNMTMPVDLIDFTVD